MAAWLWVEKLGNSQVVLADTMNLSAEAVTMMLGRLRRDGLKKVEKQHLERIYKTLTDKKKDNSGSVVEKAQTEDVAPKVIILKRQRR